MAATLRTAAKDRAHWALLHPQFLRRAAIRYQQLEKRPFRAAHEVRYIVPSTRPHRGFVAIGRLPAQWFRTSERDSDLPPPRPRVPLAQTDAHRASQHLSIPPEQDVGLQETHALIVFGLRSHAIPVRRTSRRVVQGASRRAAATVTCWPRTALTPNSKPSHPPGARKPGRCATNGASAGSSDRWPSIRSRCPRPDQ